MSYDIVSLAELSGIEDVISRDDYMLILLEDIFAADNLILNYTNSCFKNHNLSYDSQAEIFGDEFSVKYKFIGVMELFEGRAHIFRPRYVSLDGRIESKKREKWKVKIKEKNTPGETTARVREELLRLKKERKR